MKIILEFDDKSIRNTLTKFERSLKSFFSDPQTTAMLMRFARELDLSSIKKRGKKKATRKRPSKVAK